MHTSAATLEQELIFSRFDQMSEKYRNRSALVYLGEHVSYRRLKELSERFAGALSSMGVHKGHRVMLYIPNCVQWVIAFLGVQKLGGVVVPGLAGMPAVEPPARDVDPVQRGFVGVPQRRLAQQRRLDRQRVHQTALTSSFIQASACSPGISVRSPCCAGSAMWMALLTCVTGSTQK